MSLMKTIITLITIIIFSLSHCYSQDLKQGDPERITLIEIAKNINNYKAKTITIQLKLKYVDRIFEKIIFYDKKNHDIEFDISDRFIKKRIASDIINIHQGMGYNVTFIVQNIGNLGQIIAELKGFKPVILDSVPEKGK
jgi:hypothetical protein